MIEKIVRLIIQNILRINIKEETLTAVVQFIKFGIVGVTNTLISYLIYVVGLIGLRKISFIGTYDYLVAQIIAFILSVLWSFYWNNKMVFTVEEGKSRNIWKALLKTYISYSFTGLFLNSILLFLWVDIVNMSEFVAPIINLLISVPLNFLINKFWAFKSNENIDGGSISE